MIKKILFPLIFLIVTASPLVKAEESSYLDQWGHAWKRGFTNILTSPLEIPLTVQEYHEKAGRPVIRHTAGFVDGTFQMVERMGSGIWDLFAAVIPGQQEGIPVKPETLF